MTDKGLAKGRRTGTLVASEQYFSFDVDIPKGMIFSIGVAHDDDALEAKEKTTKRESKLMPHERLGRLPTSITFGQI